MADETSPSETPQYTIIDEAFAAPVILGEKKQIVLSESTVRSTPFGKNTIERWEIACGQDDMARAYMDDCLDEQTCIDAERKRQKGDNTIIEVTWAYDRDDDKWEPGDDDALWDFEIIDTSQPLMSHPYFGRNSALSDEELDVLMKEMGACDQAVSLGKPYQLQDATAAAVVQTIMQRYAGLRFSGTDEWNPILVMLSCRYRIFPSQLNEGEDPSADAWASLFSDIGRVIDLDDYDAPDFIKAALGGIQDWKYNSSGDATPEAPPQQSNSSFMWIKQKPLVKLSGRNANGPCDVTEYLLGCQQASLVLHPPMTGSEGWDPQYTITPS